MTFRVTKRGDAFRVPPVDAAAAEREALLELADEAHRDAVNKAKAQIRERRSRSIFRRLFPWRIVRLDQ